MTRITFRVEWGYNFLYSRRHYHPVYRWDGSLACEGGAIRECRALAFPPIMYGPGHCPAETPLPEPRWRSRTRRGLGGVKVVADAGPDARFFLRTASGDFAFTAARVREEGRFAFPVGPKYLNQHVIVTRDRYLWFRPPPRPGERVWDAEALPLPTRDWARMPTAWLEPGGRVALAADLPDEPGDVVERVLHVTAMAAPAYTPGAEGQVHDEFPLALYCDGEPVARVRHYFREHDEVMQLLEDVWLRFRAAPGARVLELVNEHPRFPLALTRLSLRTAARRHRQLSLPRWALAGEPLVGRVYAARPDTFRLAWPGGGARLAAAPGWNEFPFALPAPGLDVPVTADGETATVAAVYGLREERSPVKIGYDLTVVPHDANGLMDWLLDYTERTRLGNFIAFRSFLYASPENRERRPVDPALLRRWGERCRALGLTVESMSDFETDALPRGAGPAFRAAGRHEWSGDCYAADPDPERPSRDMREAEARYLAARREEVVRARGAASRVAFGDASGAHRQGYLAGADGLRTETMVAHTQHVCSLARAAAETLGPGEWGVHIALQHAMQPYHENHLGLYFLSLHQPWMMGANLIYEEDSLFQLFKEERQAWDDALTKGKRAMTRAFFRFAKTHPRRGRPRRRIAWLDGRHAAPFNGFICGGEQDPGYSVWGRYGNPDPAWGHGQPEKARHLLDVLMPGASTHPLRQRFDRRRFYFSGTPYGDFDQLPVEADGAHWRNYALILHLGWNTMVAEDYEKLVAYAEQGGTVFLGVPQLSTHVRRDFLRDMVATDLALWNGGDVARLCGVHVTGPGEAYSGQWNASGRETFPAPELSSLPNERPDEDGPCRLADVEMRGAEVAAWDAATGAPLVTRYALGKGAVYLLAAWAYPGHEALQRLSAAWIARLADEHQGDVRVEDPSREVFWTVWDEPRGRRVMLLNTDWTAPGNERRVTVHAGGLSMAVTVRERRPTILTLLPFAALETTPDPYVEIEYADASEARLTLHGVGRRAWTLHRPGGVRERHDAVFARATTLARHLAAAPPAAAARPERARTAR